jgi:polysaccharide deacetylase 2 family uncharacterized protein YibQ
MSEQELKRTLLASLNEMPFVSGVNNHMGSYLTGQTRTMGWLMEVLRDHPLYFIDSRTSASSVAQDVALAHRIPSMGRDVFLDHEQRWEFIQNQFHRLLKIAQHRGSAIAIAHPHEITVRYLNMVLPKLDEAGIRIATISALWQIRHPQQSMFAGRDLSPRMAQRLPAGSTPEAGH